MAYILWDTADSSAFSFGLTSLLQFDVVQSENHSGDATPTQHPIEEGATLTDHVKIGPDIVEMQALVTNHPVGLNPLLTQGEEIAGWISYPRVTPYRYDVRKQVSPQLQKGGVPFPIKPPGFPRPYWPISTTPPVSVTVPELGTINSKGFAGAGAYGGAGKFDRVFWIYDTLTTLRKEAVVVQLSTLLVDYPEMLITQVGAPIEGPDHIMFSLRFQSVTFATTDDIVLSVKKRAGPSEARAKPEEPSGAVPPSYFKGEELEERDKSILRRTDTALGGR